MPTDPVPEVHEVIVCCGPECGERRFSADIAAQLRRLIKARRLEAIVRLDSFRCFGKCQAGPNVLTREVGPGPAPPVVATAPGACLHLGVAPADAAGILDGLVGGPAVGEPAPSADPGALAPSRRSRDDERPLT